MSRSEDFQRSSCPYVKAASLTSGRGAQIQRCPSSQLPHCSMPKLWWYLWTLCGKEISSVTCALQSCQKSATDLSSQRVLSGAVSVLQRCRSSPHRQCAKWVSNHWQQRVSLLFSVIFLLGPLILKWEWQSLFYILITCMIKATTFH